MTKWIAIFALTPMLAYAATKNTTEAATVSDGTFPFQFKMADIADVIQTYAKITGQKFVVDANVHGKVTIINPHKVNAEEAFNLLSSSLATNGVAISQQGDTMLVCQARYVQRNLIPVVTELPPLKPEKMISWVVELKNIDADDVNKELRLIASNQGEVFPFGRKYLIMSDWVSNLYRVRDIITQIDKPGYQAPKPSPVHPPHSS